MILVTGAAGYIGSHLIYELQKKNKVIGIDNFSNSSQKCIDIIKKKDLKKNFYFYKIDCTHYWQLKKLFKKEKIKIIINCAALKNINESFHYKKKYIKNNEQSLKNIIKLMKLYKCTYLIHCSSAAIYDNKNQMPLNEMAKCKASSPYGLTKLNNEKYIVKSFKDNKFLYFILRIFNPIGVNPNLYAYNDLKKNDLVTNIKKSILKNKILKIYGKNWPTKDGTTIRDFFSILDLVDVIKKIIGKVHLDKINKSLTINLGSGNPTTTLEIVKFFEKIVKKKIKYKFVNRLKHETYRSIASIKLAKKNLKWIPKRSLKNALKSSWNYSNAKN
jgi:UDP-glucose 4-epimerase